MKVVGKACFPAALIKNKTRFN